MKCLFGILSTRKRLLISIISASFQKEKSLPKTFLFKLTFYQSHLNNVCPSKLLLLLFKFHITDKNCQTRKFEAFKCLLSCIQQKINTTEGKLRAQRLFIGYSRVLLTHIVYNKLPHTEQYLRNIMSDNIWSNIFQSYHYSYFSSWYQKWTYFLIIHKQIKLFKLSTLIKQKIKK